MSDFPQNLQYTRDHEWAKVDGDNVTVGVTQHAVDKLGDVVLVSLDVRPGDTVEAGKSFGTVESTKAVSDLFSPVSGTVLEVNAALADKPDLVNADPYQGAWMIRVKTTVASADLLDATAYAALCASDN